MIKLLILAGLLAGCAGVVEEIKGETGEQGEAGERGEAGAVGATGAEGERGPRGKAGSDAINCKTLCSKDGNNHYLIISCENSVTRSRVSSCEEFK